MLPAELTSDSFAKYPPEAKRLATSHIELLQSLPLAFLPLLLRELIVYDWKFPAERSDLENQFAYLAKRPDLGTFARLKLSRELEGTDWVNQPAIFSEQLSAHLWATHQIDSFRSAAVEYVRQATDAAPSRPLPTHRLGIAVIGQGVEANNYRLFRKLRPHGTYFTGVKRPEGMKTLLQAVAARAKSHPAPFAHWYIDGAGGHGMGEGLTEVAYDTLAGPRSTLQVRMQKTYEAAVFDPEAFRTMLAQMRPEDVGLNGDDPLNRFQLSLLTEGSGTQVFATTFVQWAAREALRRAQPLTVMTRFTPRQREKQMNELLAERQRKPELDSQGSLIDADMGAYYTWLNLRRLPGEDKSAFLVWFENHSEAVVIAPSIEKGKQSDAPIELAELIGKIA